MTDNSVQYEVKVSVGETCLQVLARESALADNLIVDAASKGAVWISRQRGRGKTRAQRLRTLNTIVDEGSTLMLNYNPQVLAQSPQTIARVSDHVNYSIWCKPSGMLCQGSKWSDHTVATQVASVSCDKPCFLVHRLDKAACGLMIIAHTKNSLKKLTAMFEQRQIDKRYQAVVLGHFTHPLPLSINEPIDDRNALTTVQVVEFDKANQQSTLQLSIETGRKHQIRKHLAALGFPIVGDRLYSAQGTEQQEHINLQLVACALSFTCPFTGKPISTSIDAHRALAGKTLAGDADLTLSHATEPVDADRSPSTEQTPRDSGTQSIALDSPPRRDPST